MTREALEEQLELLAAACSRPASGLFGPDSQFWRIHRHAVLFAGAGRAALLQLAHPFVARAIAAHSPVADDPLGRFRGTFRWIFPMIFGELDAALAAARVVHAQHQRVSGHFAQAVGPLPAGLAYRATDVGTTRWVHATLCDTSIRIYEACVAPLARAEKQAYYAESLRFAALFGLSPRLLPADWDAFQTYVDGMCRSPLLCVGPDARKLAPRLFRPRSASARRLLVAYEAWTAARLPDRLRKAYGLEAASPARTSLFDRVFRSEACWPEAVRYVPAYHEAQARLQQRSSAPLVARAVERVVFGAPPRSPHRSGTG